jgi:MFS family permease
MPLIFGPVSDRVGKMKIIAIFMIVFTVGCFLTWACNSAVQFLIGIFVIGLGFSVCECSIAAAISDFFEDKREKYINFIQSFFCIGAVLSPILLQALMNNLYASWRIVFIICAIAMIGVLPFLLLSRVDPVIKPEHIQEENKKSSPLLLIGFVICMFIYVGVESCLAFFADTVLTIELNAPEFGAFAISIFWATMGIGRFIFGRMKRIPRNAAAVFLLSLAVITACFIFVIQENTMLIMFALAGFACSCIWPGIINAAVTTNKNASGAIMSYLNFGAGTGGALLPFFIGILLTGTGMKASFLVMAIFPVLAGVFLLKYSGKTKGPLNA